MPVTTCAGSYAVEVSGASSTELPVCTTGVDADVLAFCWFKVFSVRGSLTAGPFTVELFTVAVTLCPYTLLDSAALTSLIRLFSNGSGIGSLYSCTIFLGAGVLSTGTSGIISLWDRIAYIVSHNSTYISLLLSNLSSILVGCTLTSSSLKNVK